MNTGSYMVFRKDHYTKVKEGDVIKVNGSSNMEQDIIKKIDTLKSLPPVYSGKTLDNVISQLESRIKYLKK